LRCLIGDFLSHDLAEELASIQVNVQALVGLSHALGAKMVSRGTGGIINLASNSAFQPPNFFEGVSTKMKDGAFDSAELVVRRTLRSFDQKKSVAYPGRFSVRVAIWLPRLLPRNVVVSAAASATGKMGLAS